MDGFTIPILQRRTSLSMIRRHGGECDENATITRLWMGQAMSCNTDTMFFRRFRKLVIGTEELNVSRRTQSLLKQDEDALTFLKIAFSKQTL